MRARILLSPDPDQSGGPGNEPEAADKTVTKGKKKPEDLSTERQLADLRKDFESHKGESQSALGKIQEMLDTKPKKQSQTAEPDMFDRFLTWLKT